MFFRLIILGVSGLLFFLTFAMKSNENLLTIKTAGGDRVVAVEIADSPEARRIGLMGRAELKEDGGMLFVYGEGANPVMWMRGMEIPLDMAFVGKDRKIKHFEKEIPPCTTEDSSQCETYHADEPIFWVIELPPGYLDEHDVRLGDEIILPSGLQGS